MVFAEWKKIAGRMAAGVKLAVALVAGVCAWPVALASGPHWTAGVNYFDSNVKGTPVVWANGAVSYYIDQGVLSSVVNQSEAVSMLNQAAAVWTSVQTAAITITQGGQLSEDVSGSNTTANNPSGTGATFPADAQPTATSKPVGVIMDEDGSVIDDMFGSGASDPSNCPQDGVFVQVDNIATSGNIAHGLMILNGLCATTSDQLTLMQYQMIRAWGRLLGLDWSQVNDSMFPSNVTTFGEAGWPIMHPIEKLCNGMSYACMTNETTLRLDDIAGLNRTYPVTSANQGSFPGKLLTAANTITVTGTIEFRAGQGMQGVNVVLTPVVNGMPAIQYSVAAVSGASFSGNAGNAITGPTDPYGNTLNMYGTDDQTVEGFFDLSGVPLPQGTTVSDYQLTFEAVNPDYVNVSEYNIASGQDSVGPYTTGQVTPSGTMPVLTLSQLSAGSTWNQTVTIADSAEETHSDDGTMSTPETPQASGGWLGRVVGYGHVGWFEFYPKPNRWFTVEAVATDANGLGTVNKAGVQIGLWDSADAADALPDIAQTVPFNGAVTGLTTVGAGTGSGTDPIVIAFADMRGDGRPDYTYTARLLYADSVFPATIPISGGTIVIKGQGFRPNSEVTVDGNAATVSSVSPTEITAVAPAVSAATGQYSIVTVIDPATLGAAQVQDGLTYDANGSDEIGVVVAPSGTVSAGVPVPFTVKVLQGDNVTPVSNATVTYSVTSGSANFACGSATCTATTNGAGLATMMVTPTATGTTKVTAALVSGASVFAEFNASSGAVVSAINPAVYVAIGGAQVSWSPTAIVLNGTSPVSGTSLSWSAQGGATVSGASTSATGSNGEASTSVTIGSLAANAVPSVTVCETQNMAACASFSVTPEDGSVAGLLGVSGAGQQLSVGTMPANVQLEVTDTFGRPLAGAAVTFYEKMTSWVPVCPASGRCDTPVTLGSTSVTATSDINGMVTLTPMVDAGVANTLAITASTGSAAALTFSIVEQP